MEKAGKNIYVATYYQNSYQKERIMSFINEQGVKLLNKVFEKSQRILEKAKEVWIILEGVPLHWGAPSDLEGQLPWLVSRLISYEEKIAIKLGIRVRYFRINHRGKYTGKTREVGREELVSLLVD